MMRSIMFDSRGVEQFGRRAHNPKVAGSNLPRQSEGPLRKQGSFLLLRDVDEDVFAACSFLRNTVYTLFNACFLALTIHYL